MMEGVPNVFVPKTPLVDNRFFDPSTSFENGEPRLLLVAADVQDATPVVFDSYEKEDGTRNMGDTEE
jgi:hypothetical protein